MGWICRECGTENDFSFSECRACDAIASQMYLKTELKSAKREIWRYGIQNKRLSARRNFNSKQLRRNNRILCSAMAVLVFISLVYSTIYEIRVRTPEKNNISIREKETVQGVDADTDRKADTDTGTGTGADTDLNAETPAEGIIPHTNGSIFQNVQKTDTLKETFSTYAENLNDKSAGKARRFSEWGSNASAKSDWVKGQFLSITTNRLSDRAEKKQKCFKDTQEKLHQANLERMTKANEKLQYYAEAFNNRVETLSLQLTQRSVIDKSVQNHIADQGSVVSQKTDHHVQLSREYSKGFQKRWIHLMMRLDDMEGCMRTRFEELEARLEEVNSFDSLWYMVTQLIQHYSQDILG